jgi:drug/metabolite transporter (DMT)-like permease
LSEATLSPPTETAPHDAPGRENLAHGIGFILLSSFGFVAMNTIVKLLSDHLPITEIGFFRQIISLGPIALVMKREGGVRMMRTKRPFGHLFRGAIGNLAMVPYIGSVALLPLADATTLTFASPLFVTALSVPLLAEAVGLHRWGAVLAGFVGVVIMTHPSLSWFTSGAEAGAGMGVLAAFLSAVMMITVRQLGKTEAPVTTVFYFAVIGCVIFGAILPFVWVRPGDWEWAGLAGVGLIGAFSQLCVTHAYRSAPAAALAPFTYSSILWGTLFGFLIWDQLPSRRTLEGALVVIASGLYIVYRETRRHARPNAAEVVAAER